MNERKQRGGEWQLNLAWVAGFFDGEGCVMVHRRPRPGFIEHYVTAVVGQKRQAPLIQLHKDFGGVLNAMHKAETIGLAHQLERRRYLLELSKITTKAEDWPDSLVGGWALVGATARQRSEAFLKVKGLWKE